MATAFSLDQFLHAPALDRARVIERGLPARAVRELVADQTISLSDLASVIAKRRTLDRRLADNEPLSVEESDRFARFVTIVDLAQSIFGGRKAAMEWLRTPKQRFGDTRPLDLLRTHAGADIVESVLQQARHGLLA